MKYIVEKNLCCGCGACSSICPTSAITMQYDREGFIYPILDEDKCINCKACGRVCPVIAAENKEYPEYLKTYAGYSEDNEVMSGCTSGGFATILSKVIIDDGGTVFGVKYSDDFTKAEYTHAKTYEELDSMMGSKYVQSEKNRVFSDVKDVLKKGHKVLFVGCPCDVAALKLYLDKDYCNLYTCELVCMGVTSYRIAEEYKQYTEKKNKAKLISINARSKKNGWFVPTLEEKFDNGKIKYTTLYASYYGYGSQVYNRPSCFNCRYRDKNGLADFRVGDFWGIKDTDEFWNPEGVSCIFARTEKALSLVPRIREKGFRFFETEYKKATESNMSSLKNKSQHYVALRARFAEVFFDKGLISACNATASWTFRVKRIIPRRMQSMLKKIYHKFVDKR